MSWFLLAMIHRMCGNFETTVYHRTQNFSTLHSQDHYLESQQCMKKYLLLVFAR